MRYGSGKRGIFWNTKSDKQSFHNEYSKCIWNLLTWYGGKTSVVLLSGITTLGSELAFVNRPVGATLLFNALGGPGLCSKSLSGELA